MSRHDTTRPTCRASRASRVELVVTWRAKWNLDLYRYVTSWDGIVDFIVECRTTFQLHERERERER